MTFVLADGDLSRAKPAKHFNESEFFGSVLSKYYTYFVSCGYHLSSQADNPLSCEYIVI